MISDACESFHALPQSGGILDQPADLIEGIRLWRFMRHVKDLMEKENGMDQIIASPAMFHVMNVIEMGEEEATRLRDEAEERNRRAMEESSDAASAEQLPAPHPLGHTALDQEPTSAAVAN